MPGQGGVELPLQRGVVGQGGQQGLAGRLVGGGVVEALAGVGERGDPGGGGQQERPEDLGRGLPLVVLELEVLLAGARRRGDGPGCGRGYDGVGAWLPPGWVPSPKPILRSGLAPIYVILSNQPSILELLRSVITMTVWPISGRSNVAPSFPSRYTESGRWTRYPMESPRMPPR